MICLVDSLSGITEPCNGQHVVLTQEKALGELGRPGRPCSVQGGLESEVEAKLLQTDGGADSQEEGWGGKCVGGPGTVSCDQQLNLPRGSVYVNPDPLSQNQWRVEGQPSCREMYSPEFSTPSKVRAGLG